MGVGSNELLIFTVMGSATERSPPFIYLLIDTGIKVDTS